MSSQLLVIDHIFLSSRPLPQKHLRLFAHTFCDPLADSLIKPAPSKSSPKTLVERRTSPDDFPIKIPTETDNASQIASPGLQDKLVLFSWVCGIPTGKKLSITRFACPLWISKESRPSRHRRPHLQYPVDVSHVAPIPDHITQVFAEETTSILKP